MMPEYVSLLWLWEKKWQRYCEFATVTQICMMIMEVKAAQSRHFLRLFRCDTPTMHENRMEIQSEGSDTAAAAAGHTHTSCSDWAF